METVGALPARSREGKQSDIWDCARVSRHARLQTIEFEEDSCGTEPKEHAIVRSSPPPSPDPSRETCPVILGFALIGDGLPDQTTLVASPSSSPSLPPAPFPTNTRSAFDGARDNQ